MAQTFEQLLNQHEDLVAVLSKATKRLFTAQKEPARLLIGVRNPADRGHVDKVLSACPHSITAIEEAISFTRIATSGNISWELAADADDDGPPLTLYIRIPYRGEPFSQHRDQILDWWYDQHLEESRQVLLMVLPGRG